jgi:type II secretory pathway pseudopilin PulG
MKKERINHQDANMTQAPALRARPSSSFPRAFSFTEIMFAVVILGIGFIMVAAIFPVALQQAKATSDEVNATTIARSATNQFSQFLRDGNGGTATSNCPPLTNSASISLVRQLTTNDSTLTAPAVSLWTALSGNMILTQDPRFAWVTIFRRGGNPTQTGTWDPYIQLFVFPVQVRNRTIFTSDDVKLYTNGMWSTNNPTANLMAHPVRVMIANDVPDAGGADLIAFDTSSGTDEEKFNVAAVAEGAYVVISDDAITAPTGNQGLMNGRIFRVGARREDLDGRSDMTDAFGNPIFPVNTTEVYELAPGNEFTPDPGANGKFGDSDDILDIGISVGGVNVQAGGAHAFVIGRGYADPNNPSSGFEGDAMPISAFTTYLRVQ